MQKRKNAQHNIRNDKETQLCMESIPSFIIEKDLNSIELFLTTQEDQEDPKRVDIPCKETANILLTDSDQGSFYTN